jgi:hypothetical protein
MEGPAREQLCDEMLMTEPECERPIRDGVLGCDGKFEGSCSTIDSTEESSESEPSDSDARYAGLRPVRGGERR